MAWGLATECAPAAALDARFEILLGRIARMPINQLVMMKLLINQTVQSAGLAATQILGTVFDGIARHTREGYAFQRRAAEAGFKQAVRERDEPFGDFGPSHVQGLRGLHKKLGPAWDRGRLARALSRQRGASGRAARGPRGAVRVQREVMTNRQTMSFGQLMVETDAVSRDVVGLWLRFTACAMSKVTTQLPSDWRTSSCAATFASASIVPRTTAPEPSSISICSPSWRTV